MGYQFIWDEEKNLKNILKHGISFETAKEVFKDPLLLESYDWKHSINEDRWKAVGLIGWKLLKVSYTLKNKKIRLISAKKAEKKDKEKYYGNS